MEITCQMDCLGELRGYSQGAQCEVTTKIEMKKWEKKAAESCKKVLKKKIDATWCLIRYGGGGWGVKQGDSYLEPERTSVPLTNKEVSRNWFLGKFNFRNFKFELLPGYPNLTPSLSLLLWRIRGKYILLPERVRLLTNQPILIFPVGFLPSPPGFSVSFLDGQYQVFFCMLLDLRH